MQSKFQDYLPETIYQLLPYQIATVKVYEVLRAI